jgi:hypothetical protein
MANIYSFTDTWNDSGTAFTGIGLDITGTAFNSNTSRLISITLSGNRKFDITTAGVGYISYGLECQNSNFIGGNKNYMGSNCLLGWTNAYNNAAYGTPDIFLAREAAAVMQQYGGSPQTYRIYNTYTDASNYERLSIGWSTNVMTIGTEAAGTGTQRNLVFSSANQSAYIASPTAAEIRDILISFGFMAAS